MSRFDGREWGGRRRRAGGRTLRSNAFWILSTILVLAASGLVVVGQKVRFNGVHLATDAARSQNDKLRSDLNSHQLRHQRQATRAELLTLAASMGLTETGASAARLVAFETGHGLASPGLMDHIVSPALANDAPLEGSSGQRRPSGGATGR